MTQPGKRPARECSESTRCKGWSTPTLMARPFKVDVERIRTPLNTNVSFRGMATTGLGSAASCERGKPKARQAAITAIAVQSASLSAFQPAVFFGPLGSALHFVRGQKTSAASTGTVPKLPSTSLCELALQFVTLAALLTVACCAKDLLSIAGTAASIRRGIRESG